MQQLFHGRAGINLETYRVVKNSRNSFRTLAERYSINVKTVTERRNRKQTAANADNGPKERKSTGLTVQEEALIIAFRKHTRLPLDECFAALQEAIPNLSRSSLHRCLQRNGISRMPEFDKDETEEEPGCFNVDITEIATDEGARFLFVAIDRAGKQTFTKLYDEATTQNAQDFLETIIKGVPYEVHTIITDGNVRFADANLARPAGAAVRLVCPCVWCRARKAQ